MLGAVASTSIAVGQPDRATPVAQRAGWLPRETKLDPSLTTAEKATILKRLNEIERLVLQVPELARPDGFLVRPAVHAAAHEIWPVIQGHPKGHNVVQAFELSARPAIKGEEMTCLSIIVNPLPIALFLWHPQNDLEDGKGDRLYIEHPFGETMPGALLAYADKVFDADEPVPPVKPIGLSPKNQSYYAVFFSADGISPWLEVTRQEYLEALIWNGETKHLDQIKRGRELLTKTRYQQWMEEAPKRKRERDEALATAEKANPSQAAAMRKELETTERQITEQLKAAEEQDRAENARELATATPDDQFRARLAAMTPAERAMPAWTNKGGGVDEFFQPNAPGAVRIVRANPAFYRPRSSRIEPRGVMLRFTASLFCHSPAVQRAFYAVRRSFDYSALRRLLELEPR
jgi:hypothetical protein